MKDANRYSTPILLFAAAASIAGALLYTHSGGGITGGTPAGVAAPAVAVAIQEVKTDANPFIGSKDAPTTLALFYDYQCPFGKPFEQTVLPQLIKNYVSTGKLRIVFKDFQFLGEDSTTAGLYARAVWELYPSSYYDWYRAVFAAQDTGSNQRFGSLASIQKLTATIPGIDSQKVTDLMNRKKEIYLKAITADRAEGAALGIKSTPTIIVGTKLLTGLSSAEYYAAISMELDKELRS